MIRVPKHPLQRKQGYYRRRKRAVRILLTVIALSMALLFLTPIVLTITNSFMTQDEITANYGAVFGNASTGDQSGSKAVRR